MKKATEYQRRYRAKYPEKYKARNKRLHKKRYNDPVQYKAMIDYHRRIQGDVRKACTRLKTETSCKDCGKYDEPFLMDFDHLEGTNNRSPQACRSIPEMQRELTKCDIVCVRCHRIRTHKRRIDASEA